MKLLEEKYSAAIETHRHYDTLSLSVVIGMFGIAYACYSLHKDLHTIMETQAIFFGGAAVVMLLFMLYWRLANYAAVARYVSAQLENSDAPGISSAYLNGTNTANQQKGLLNRLTSVRVLVFAIALGLCTALLVSGYSL